MRTVVRPGHSKLCPYGMTRALPHALKREVPTHRDRDGVGTGKREGALVGGRTAVRPGHSKLRPYGMRPARLSALEREVPTNRDRDGVGRCAFKTATVSETAAVS